MNSPHILPLGRAFIYAIATILVGVALGFALTQFLSVPKPQPTQSK